MSDREAAFITSIVRPTTQRWPGAGFRWGGPHSGRAGAANSPRRELAGPGSRFAKLRDEVGRVRVSYITLRVSGRRTFARRGQERRHRSALVQHVRQSKCQRMVDRLQVDPQHRRDRHGQHAARHAPDKTPDHQREQHHHRVQAHEWPKNTGSTTFPTSACISTNEKNAIPE